MRPFVHPFFARVELFGVAFATYARHHRPINNNLPTEVRCSVKYA
jgi:hypothetical protein